jgi:hypothetical protein
MPDDPTLAQSLFNLRQSLLLLAQQDAVVMVTWANLASSGLTWDEAVKLVPPDVMASSMPDLDHLIGPETTDVVPRRVLELIRAQLDACAAEWVKVNAQQATMSEVSQQVTAWTQVVLDQAKRVQLHKRPAEQQLVPPTPTPAPATPHPDIPATQLDSTQSQAS